MNRIRDSFSFLTIICYTTDISDFILLDIESEKEGMLKIMWSSSFQFVFQFIAVKHEYAENHFSDCLASFMQKISIYCTGSILKFLLSFVFFLKKECFKKQQKMTKTNVNGRKIEWNWTTLTLESLHLFVAVVCFKKSNDQWATESVSLNHQEVKTTKDLATMNLIWFP